MLLIELYIFSFTLSLSLSLSSLFTTWFCSSFIVALSIYAVLPSLIQRTVMLFIPYRGDVSLSYCTCSLYEDVRAAPHWCCDRNALVHSSFSRCLSQISSFLSCTKSSSKLEIEMTHMDSNRSRQRAMRVHDIISLWAQMMVKKNIWEGRGKHIKMTNMWSFVDRFFIDNEWKKVVNNFIILSFSIRRKAVVSAHLHLKQRSPADTTTTPHTFRRIFVEWLCCSPMWFEIIYNHLFYVFTP